MEIVKTTKRDQCDRINLYKTPPFGQLTLEECEDLFRQRLEALHVLANEKSISVNNMPTISAKFREIKSYVYKTNCILLRFNDQEQHKQDHFSHMLARMYFVYQPNQWLWFRNNERSLLYYRLRDQASSLSGAQLESILQGFNFNFERVTGIELQELLKENLIGWNKQTFEKDLGDIFRVKFTDALQFVKQRSVSLKDGYAFLTRFEIISVVCDVFERHLDHELKYARQHLNVELIQTQQLLQSLDLVYTDFAEKIEEEKRKSKRLEGGDRQNPYRIDIDNLEEIVKNHYPPCMRYLHQVLLEDHHLKHQGRLYYGTFLRSGGVDMESAIEFWRREFTKKMPNDKFERDYKYNIRHLYGREGAKKELTCFSCDKIIKDNPPGPSEKHGCPFRHFDDAHLKDLLVKHGLKPVDIESIFLHTNEKDYKGACSHYFKFVKGDLPSEPIKNPIHYYYESMRLANRPVVDQSLEMEQSNVE